MGCNCSACKRAINEALYNQETKTIMVDGEEKQVEYVGSGLYSIAFRSADRVYLITSQRDYTKLAISERFKDSKNPHIPKITRHADQADGRRTFSMPYYKSVEDKDDGVVQVNTSRNSAYAASWQRDKALKAIANDKTLPRQLRGALYGMARALSKSKHGGGDWVFDTWPQNFSRDENNNLILRDIFAP